jgi:hypothetical protein
MDLIFVLPIVLLFASLGEAHERGAVSSLDGEVAVLL